MEKELGRQVEVMHEIRPVIAAAITRYLKEPDAIWQPSDYLPSSESPDFLEDVALVREAAKAHSDELLAVLVGDAITEEALPTYTSWLVNLAGGDQRDSDDSFAEWMRRWTAEEKGHGVTLDRWMYLSGRINTREVEISTRHLIADGFDNRASELPYHNIIYVSFQELATNRSHRNVASLARKNGDATLAKICGVIAGDESRHAKAYQHFGKEMFERDPSGMMLAFQDMMRAKIVMPAELLRESGGWPGEAYEKFADVAQTLEVYTTEDYLEILESLIQYWGIADIKGLSPEAEEAQEFILGLPKRLRKIVENRAAKNPKTADDPPKHKFKWIIPNE